jgi:hypothetical protein
MNKNNNNTKYSIKKVDINNIDINNIDIFISKTGKKYKTKYGLPFQCVELIRRFFSIIKNVSFSSIVDAVEFFNVIETLDNSKDSYKLKTYSYPYIKSYSYYLKPGSIIFWKYKKTYFPYGHVALIIDSNEKETTIIQQNLNPPVKIYDTKTLFDKMNDSKSKFAGIKTIPKILSKNIDKITYDVITV